MDLPAFLFALLHVERTVRLIEQAERLPAETIIRDAVSARWARVTDLHLSVAQVVAEVIEERFGEGDPDTRAAMKLSEESLREVWDNEDDGSGGPHFDSKCCCGYIALAAHSAHRSRAC